MKFSAARRQRIDEWIDRPNLDPRLLRRSLRFIRQVNRFLGYTRATLNHLESFSRRWRPGERIRILDLATGSADIPRAILKWADRRGFDVRVVGMDLHPQTLRLAAEPPRDPRLTLVRGDALHPPFADGSFDYAITNMFLHHLDEPDAVAVLRRMDRLSRRGIIAADLLRARSAYAWISLFTLLANPAIRHDARASVAQAFTRPEAIELARQAGVDYLRYHRHRGLRYILAGEKSIEPPMGHR